MFKLFKPKIGDWVTPRKGAYINHHRHWLMGGKFKVVSYQGKDPNFFYIETPKGLILCFSGKWEKCVTLKRGDF